MKCQHRFVGSKRIVFQLLLMLVILAAQSDSLAKDIVVSVDGDAQADGSLAKPYGSLPDAVEAVRALRKAGNTEPAKIILREGRHQLNQTLVLGLDDGSPSDPKPVKLSKYGAGPSSGPAYLTFSAYPGETPVVSAGVPVTGWKQLESAPAELPAKAAGKVWVADMPEGLDKFYTLYDHQGRLNRARDAGFPVTQSGDRRTLHFPEGRLRNWGNISDVEVQVRPGVAWVVNMLPLESVDETTGIAKTSVSASGSFTKLAPYLQKILGESAPTVWVENILDELDEPGEWVVNSETRKIYLWPSDPAPDGSPRGILAPCASELIRIEGSIDYMGPEDIPVRGIVFSGLTFSHADRWAWTKDEDKAGWGMQHDWDISDRPTSLLRFRGAEDCQVNNCTFIASGGSGVRLDLHAQRNRIENCEFAHLGEAAIIMGGYGPGTKDVNHHNSIINNHIHHFSQITWHSPGVWAWQSGHNHIAHNFVHHAGYSGILITCRARVGSSRRGNEGGNRPESEERKTLVRAHEIDQEAVAGAGHDYEGWKRREPYLHGRNNLVEYNEITHMVQLLSDGNGVYISGTGGGNIIRYNYLHDNAEAHLPAPIRCDGDQHETTILGNVIYNNSAFASAIASHGVNHMINNFVVQPLAVPMKGYFSFIQYSAKGAQVHHNILISNPEGGLAHGEIDKSIPGVPNIEEIEMDSNLYYHPTDPTWIEEHLKRMQAVGKEKASLFGDPLFVDPAGGDFSFRPGSPALALGIESLDVSKMGLKKAENEGK
ncbi:right-handed parallel beta-helix repeat-containing protein [Planctomycetota bacterium]